ncbi:MULTISPECIES: hypothetical protein [unclassified Variovorax]|uniref:hypothetical protein n=1 Tax=unclassified Variovorax TaxID=663243 RepID=UPI0015FEE22C|nr:MULTISPECIES: hypothetical protein [unclassified Variovorax]MDM0088157.1 hypothetical protein [Variovorax sp. J22G40]MDM0146230.1 hypothetical protein [Variovorax sp. J2P1-31]
MTALSSPSFALRPQRDSLRSKQSSLSRSRAAGVSTPGYDGLGGTAADSVFKRFPAIGDTPSLSKQRG